MKCHTKVVTGVATLSEQKNARSDKNQFGQAEPEMVHRFHISVPKNGDMRYICTTIDLHDRSVVASITNRHITQRTGIRTAIGSSSKNTPFILERLGLGLILEKIGLFRYFDAVVDGNSVSRATPDPEECMVFEDSKAYGIFTPLSDTLTAACPDIPT